jgi:hypothetical protein
MSQKDFSPLPLKHLALNDSGCLHTLCLEIFRKCKISNSTDLKNAINTAVACCEEGEGLEISEEEASELYTRGENIEHTKFLAQKSWKKSKTLDKNLDKN